VNITCKISYTRDIVRKAIFETLPSFRVSTWKKRGWSKRNDLFSWFCQLWVKTLYHIAYIKNDSNSFEREISIFKIVNGQPKKVEDEDQKGVILLWDAVTWSNRHFWALSTTIDPCESRTWRKKTVYWQWEKASDTATG